MNPEEAEKRKEERKRKLREAAEASAESGRGEGAFGSPEYGVPDDASTPVRDALKLWCDDNNDVCPK
jgi:hypothetical protein